MRPLDRSVLTGALVGAALGCATAALASLPVEPPLRWLAAACAGALLGGVLTERFFARPMRVLLEHLQQALQDESVLLRPPRLRWGAAARVAGAMARLTERLGALRASVADQGAQLEEARRRLQLEAELQAKHEELTRRLRERELLFEVLRESARQRRLQPLLEALAERLAEALRLREVGLLLREADEQGERFVLRAVAGAFEAPASLLGRAIVAGEGVAGEAARRREPIVVEDVASDPRYLAFWGEVPREGPFVAVPVLRGQQLVGLIAATRPAGARFRPEELRLLAALADQVAVVVHRAQLFEELERLSEHDPLTGLANRRRLDRQLEMEMERARRFGQPLSAVLFDIDHFKQINDRLGHAAGDEVLRAVAEALRGHVRKVDTVARVGGEEFVVLLPRATLSEARAVADKLRRHVRALQVPGASEQPAGALTISAGVAEWQPGDTAETLLAAADEALYRAKRSGRDRVEVAERRPEAESASAPPPR